MRSAVAEAMPLGGETVSAVIVIGHAPMMSIDQLSRILRLTHGGAVRLVDRLVERNLVDKQPSAIDRRIMTLARSEEHTSELQSLMRISYAVFCLKKRIT